MCTFSTHSPLMWSKGGSVVVLLKSTMTSFVFLVFSARLMSEHQVVSLCRPSVSLRDQSTHCSVASKFSNGVIPVGRTAFVGVETVQESAYNSALWSTSAQGGGVMGAESHYLAPVG